MDVWGTEFRDYDWIMMSEWSQNMFVDGKDDGGLKKQTLFPVDITPC